MRKTSIVLAGLAVFVAGYWVLHDAVWLDPRPYGDLTVSAGLVDKPVVMGTFSLTLESTDRPRLIIRRDGNKQPVFESAPGKAFVAAARAEDHFHEARGMARVKSNVLERCVDQTVESLGIKAGEAVIEGRLACPQGALPYRLSFRSGGSQDLVFDFSLASEGARSPYNVTYLIAASHKDEGFYGFGEQFSYFDQKGRRLPILVSEQGIGRGLQPITLGADITNNGAGGKWHTSYAGVPHFITTDNKSLLLESHRYSVFDLRRPDVAVIELHDEKMSGRLIAGNGPLELIENYTAITGRMRPLPEWVTRGAIIGLQGGTEKVRRTLAQLEARQTPLSAFWLQDWVGQRVTSFGKQLWWNWTLDKNRYPEWPKLVDDLKRRNIEVMTYINPFLADVEERRGEQGSAYRNLFREAKDKGYLVTADDGHPYMVLNTSFSAGLIDLTNPEAWKWMKEVIRSEVIAIGSKGWMADFGEGFPMDGRTRGKVDPLAHHNAYPELWAKLNREAIEEAGLGTTATFFSRSGYTRSPAYSTLFWLGDQLVTWDHHDGLKTAVTGLLSSGISGYAFNHSDIGGYTTITNPLKNYHRTKELQMRWAELSAFNAVFRSHEGNRPDANWQFNSDEETLSHFVRMAKVYACWAPYRRKLVNEAAEKGLPVVRHPYLHYPADPNFRRMDSQQFMVGADFMVAPVLDQGMVRLSAYLPDDQWVDLWTGEAAPAGRAGRASGLGRPPVFYRKGSAAGEQTRKCLEEQKLL